MIATESNGTKPDLSMIATWNGREQGYKMSHVAYPPVEYCIDCNNTMLSSDRVEVALSHITPHMYTLIATMYGYVSYMNRD